MRAWRKLQTAGWASGAGYTLQGDRFGVLGAQAGIRLEAGPWGSCGMRADLLGAYVGVLNSQGWKLLVRVPLGGKNWMWISQSER